MTDYTKQVNFAVKDGLSSGNANKAILGTEIDTEFNEIATAVATKADSASPTFTGSASAATLDVATFQIDGVEVTATPAELNILDGATVTTAELNILDGVTATAAELNYVDGVTSNIQTQIDSKIAGNETITLSGDASGSGTTSITVVVADDSHSHTGSTISGLAASDTTSGEFADARISESSVTQHESAIDAGSVDGYDIVVDSGSPSGTDANTIYFVT